MIVLLEVQFSHDLIFIFLENLIDYFELYQ